MAESASESITVAADKAAVMGVIADFDRYPEWSRELKKVEVIETGTDGRAKQVHFVLDAGVLKDDYVLEYDWQGDDKVEWHLVKGNLLKGMNGTYTLRGSGGQTEVTYDLAVELAIPMIGMIRRKAEKAIINTALNGLKKRVESGV